MTRLYEPRTSPWVGILLSIVSVACAWTFLRALWIAVEIARGAR